ncbi:hypothetical protein NBRC116592_04200 [Colwellia sp. KU-HH00111]|uniref:hypothetical protein n=1 Tax=Colwellia sp. KU-HH00111 TaxID=3127652 RepID=UPI00310607E6
MKYYINVLRLDNFEVDFRNGFSTLAIAERKLKLSTQLSEGDMVISYVSSRVSSFASIRSIVNPSLIPSAKILEYDVPIHGYIETRPELVLKESEWVRVKDIIQDLSFIKHKKYWMNKFLNSLFEINKKDFHIIRKLMVKSQKN